MHGDPELAAGSEGSERRLSRWHSARAFLRRAAATLDSGSSMLLALAVQKSLAATMKGCKSAMLGKAKAKSDGQSKCLAKTRSRRPSGTLASVRKRIAANMYNQCRWQALDQHLSTAESPTSKRRT